MTKSKVHYSGEIMHSRGWILPGFAACCSGERAYKIRREGRNTPVAADVTCGLCQKKIVAHNEWARRKKGRRTI